MRAVPFDKVRTALVESVPFDKLRAHFDKLRAHFDKLRAHFEKHRAHVLDRLPDLHRQCLQRFPSRCDGLVRS